MYAVVLTHKRVGSTKIGQKLFELTTYFLHNPAPNARHQTRLKAGARDERTLEAVACMPWFGLVYFAASQEAYHVYRGGEAMSDGAFLAQDVFDLPL